ncbi:hypothetical protein JW758_03845 [Candidatus Peregrinibacteria bacterium]|nr:hypothetical protein [Candidatus Peregrinibacteria bacterium]
MAIDIPKQSGENKQNAEKANSQANVQAKSGAQETVSSNDEFQRRWIQQQEAQRENQKRLAQQGAIKNAKDRQSAQRTSTSVPKKKFMKGMAKYLIPSIATGSGIVGILFGLN